MRPERIGPTLTARRARTLRAVGAWIDAGNDLRGVDRALLEQAAFGECDIAGRDLDASDVHRILTDEIRAHVHAREHDEERERERLAYLARVRAGLLLTRDDDSPERGRDGR